MTVLNDYENQGRSGLVRHIRSLGLVSTLENSPKPPRVVVFLRCKNDSSLDGLAQQGIRVNQPKGNLRTAIVPLDTLSLLSNLDDVDYIIPSSYVRPLMDVAPVKTRVPEFRNKHGLSGRGVVVGIVDTGIDPNHPAFTGRILRIWDQVLPGPGVPEGTYGAELTGPLMAVSRDVEGHGTHVAGIAAGSEINTAYPGVAPGAEVLIVKSDLMDAHIADGIRYIFRVAAELKRPAVVNLSLGGHFDAHDGSDPLSEIIDNESGPGRIVCCAAGNEGNDNIHAQKAIAQGTKRTIRFVVPKATSFDSIHNVRLNGWYSGNNRMHVSVRSPSGFQTPYQDIISSGSPVRTYDLPDGRVRITTPSADPVNKDHNFLVDILGASLSSIDAMSGTWKLQLKGASITDNEGRVDVWILDDAPYLDAVFTGTSVKDSMKIGSPGAAKRSVTVASYTTKASWKDIDGTQRDVGFDLDDISDFSSEGPLRDGSQKPDMAAPGAMIAAPLSADSTVERANMVSQAYRVNAGTSMATPFVAGIMALLLERNPSLNPEEAKSLLKANSKIPGQPQGTFNPKWGFGLISASGL